MRVDELERGLARIAGPADTRISATETRLLATRFRRRRQTTRAGVAIVFALASASLGAFASGRLSTGQSVAIEARSEGDPIATLSQEGVPSFDVLAEAIRNDDLTAVSVLISAGTDVDGAGDFGFTPLMIASIRGNPDTIEFLVGLGADLAPVSQSGHTALHLSARSGNVAAIEALLRAGADPEAQTNNRFGSTALMIAVGHNHVPAIEVLIESGADVNAIDATGRPVVRYALDTIDTSPDDGVARQLISLLADAGANAETSNGETIRLSGLSIDEALALLIESDSPRQS